jgi:hypothetical protein
LSLKRLAEKALREILTEGKNESAKLAAAQTIAKWEEAKECAREAKNTAKATKERDNKPPEERDPEEVRRKVAQILGIDPDQPRINPDTNQFEGPGAEALNIQRNKLIEEDKQEEERTKAPERDEEPKTDPKIPLDNKPRLCGPANPAK